MGCCGSTTAESPVPEQRRRLSISKIGLQETQSTATEESLTEEERGCCVIVTIYFGLCLLLS